MRSLATISSLFLWTFLAGCTDAMQPMPELHREVPMGFEEMAYPEDNEPTPERIALGRKLFFDKELSRDRTVSCATCHRPEYAFSDAVPLSRGVEQRVGTRNTPSLINVGYQPHFMREGGVPTLEMQALVPIQEHVEMDMNILEVAERLNDIPEYFEMSLDAYDRVPDPYVITRALAAFQRTLVSANARFDLFMRFSDPTLLSIQERRGMSLFFSDAVGCAGCHDMPYFTSHGFANNGLYETYEDPGRFRLTNEPSDRGVFKIPSLRNIAVTGPYMHDGSLYALELVVKHYNDGGEDHPNKDPRIRPLGLTEAQQEDLVAFLYSLTDEDFVNSPALRK